MDVPSSSHVTGRRKRIANRDDDDDDESLGRSTPLRKVRGNKQAVQHDVAPDTIMAAVNEYVDDIVTKKKVGSGNCFTFKSPLELYGIEQMIEANASIHEMAVVLDGVNQIIAYRVDRLLADVRSVDTALCNGDVARGQQGSDEVHINVDNRKLKKKMAVADGMNQMADFFVKMANEEKEREERERSEPDEETIAGEERLDPKANSLDVDPFLERDVVIEDRVQYIAIKRVNTFKELLNKNSSRFVMADDTAHDIKDTNVDWLRSNPTFQKATKGSLDNTANSFHSLNYYGMHSPSGRAFMLHSRIEDSHENDVYFPSDVNFSLAKNTCGLLENALDRRPMVLDNYLMLEVKDRPVVGRYKIIGKDTKKSVLPLSEASRECDLANLTFAEMNRTVSADTGSSDMSMLGGQGLPLTRGSLDQTIVLGGVNPAFSVSNKSANDEYVTPPIEALGMEESLIGKVNLDPINMDELNKIFDEKITSLKTSHVAGSNYWKNGMRAEEWGENDDAKLRGETRNAVSAGIEGWIKATDSWTNYDVVKMIVHRDIMVQRDEELPNELESRRYPPIIGKSYFLMKSDDYLNNYQPDRHLDIKMTDEELDFMMMLGSDEKSDDENVSQVPQEIIHQHDQHQMEPEQDHHIEPMDYEPGGGGEDFAFDGDLAEPVEIDNIDNLNHRVEDDGDANILFNDQIADNTVDVGAEQERQRNLEQAGLAADEVAELLTSAPPPQLVEPTAEMRDEIRNAGRADNAHWVPPDVSDQEKPAQRKKKEKKLKSRKATVEDFVHYFRDIPDDELEREMTIKKCSRISDEKSTFLSEQQLYLPSLGIQNRPHVAFEMGLLGNSGLFFKKSYGKIRLERIKPQILKEEDLSEDSKGGSDSDCLNWLMTFSGFKCMENAETVEVEPSHVDVENYQEPDDYVNELYADEYADQIFTQDAPSRMGPDLQKKFANFRGEFTNMFSNLHHREGDYDDSDDEFDDSFDRQSIQARNLDAAKHKKCLAEILRNEKLSMPSIQFALETLTINNQSMRQNNTTVGEADETVRSSTPTFDADKTLTSVFEYHSPKKLNVTVQDVMKALTDVPEFEAETEEATTSDNQPSTSSEYGTANTKNRKVHIQGCHTLLSLALSMPTKMQEVVKPSSIVSFLLHIANENSLRIVQDRSKRAWMSDFIVLNNKQALPRGLKMGNLEDLGDFWKRVQDPDAIEGSLSDNTDVFAGVMGRPKAVAVRKKGGAAAIAGSIMHRGESDLGNIEEEENEEEEGEEMEE